MIRLKMKNYNTIWTDKIQKYQHYNPGKLINMNLTGEEILPSNQSKLTEQAKYTYQPLGEALKNKWRNKLMP